MKKFILAAIIIGISINFANAQLRVSSIGFVGIGNVSPIEQFQIGDRFTFSNGGTKYFGYNAYWNPTLGDARMVTGYSSRIAFTSSGDIAIGTGVSGSANTAIISWTTPFVVYNNGTIKINTNTRSYCGVIFDKTTDLHPTIRPEGSGSVYGWGYLGTSSNFWFRVY